MRDTSLKAYLNEIAPTLGARHIKVLEVFEQNDGKDFSNAELSCALEWPINTVTPRTNELVKLGILEESRRRLCGVTNRTVHAWRVKDRPAISPKAVSHLPNRYQMPSVSQPGQTHKIVDDNGPRCDCKGFLFRGRCSHLEKLMHRTPKPEETMTSLFA